MQLGLCCKSVPGILAQSSWSAAPLLSVVCLSTCAVALARRCVPLGTVNFQLVFSPLAVTWCHPPPRILDFHPTQPSIEEPTEYNGTQKNLKVATPTVCLSVCQTQKHQLDLLNSSRPPTGCTAVFNRGKALRVKFLQ